MGSKPNSDNKHRQRHHLKVRAIAKYGADGSGKLLRILTADSSTEITQYLHFPTKRLVR